MSDKNNCIDKNSSCCNEVNFKKNCRLGCCDNIVVKDIDIYQAECVPVLTERIFDCITLEDFKYRVENSEFTIVSTSKCSYDEEAPICIDKVGVTYDFIGIEEQQKQELVNSENITFSAQAGTGYTCGSETFYNEYIASFITNKCCPASINKQGIKSRILESDVQFYICNLQIVLIGTIGNKPFKAVSGTVPYTGPIFDGTSLDFCGRICLPKGTKKSTIIEEYDGCLSVECVTTDDVYSSGNDTFTAAVEFLLVVEKTMYSTLTEKLAVFTLPDAVICHSGEVDHVCEDEKCTEGNTTENNCRDTLEN